MNVLYIATYEGLSGASYSLLGMIKEMEKMGVKPYVVLLKDGNFRKVLDENTIPYKIIKGYPWVVDKKKYFQWKQKLYWQVKKICNWRAEYKIQKLIKEKNIEIIHINAFTASVGLAAAKKMRKPCVWHIREFVEEDLGKFFWNYSTSLEKLQCADRIIAISESVRDKYKMQVPNANYNVIYNGVNDSLYKTKRDKEIFSDDIIEISIIGRVDPGKGHKELLEAIRLLLIFSDIKLHLRIVGISQDRKYGEGIKKYVIEHNMDKNVEFTGYREDVSSIHKSSDIVVVASKAEAFGRVTVEAMMAGALVIGADTAGTKELIQNKYGLLYKQGNEKSLAQSIWYAVNHKEEMKEISNSARVYALKTFTTQNNAKLVYEVYKEISVI